MKRRDFITLVGGAVAAWPLAARAQQPSIPVVGWLGAATPEVSVASMAAFRRGLSENGFVDGHNVEIEYRWAESRYARLPAMAADLVSRKVDAIVASGQSAAQIARRLGHSRGAVCGKLRRLGLKRGHAPPTAKPKIVSRSNKRLRQSLVTCRSVDQRSWLHVTARWIGWCLRASQ